jgi:hypothetical protein
MFGCKSGWISVFILSTVKQKKAICGKLFGNTSCHILPLLAQDKLDFYERPISPFEGKQAGL